MAENFVQEEHRVLKYFAILLIVISGCKPQVTTVLPPGHNTGVPRGILDISVAFPGEGIYSDYDTMVLTVSSVCSDKALFGSTGTATCLSGSTSLPAGVGDVLSGQQYWDSTGTKRTGTMPNRGGSWDLTTAFPGAGYYSGFTSAISAAEVCTTKTILGSTGTAVCNSTFADLTASQAVRTDLATIDLSSSAAVDARARAVLTDEVAGNSTYSNNHLLVPNPKYDTDGQGDDSGIGTTLRHYLETVKGRPTKVCGLAGSYATRIADCNTQNGTKATWEGKKYGQYGEADWKLVTLYKAGAASGDACAGGAAAGCYEVWRDERTQLIWSDYINNNGNSYNWFRAAGYSSSATTVAVTGLEGRAGVATDCTDITTAAEVCQPATPITACASASAIAGLNGVATYQDVDGTGGTYDERPAKGNISAATAQWRLPTYGDWAQAYADGINKVLPTMTGSVIFWTATSYSLNRNQAWVVGWSGLFTPASRGGVYGLRCVGH